MCVHTYTSNIKLISKFSYKHANKMLRQSFFFLRTWILLHLPAITRSTNALSFCIYKAVMKKNKLPSTATNIVRNNAYCKLRNSRSISSWFIIFIIPASIYFIYSSERRTVFSPSDNCKQSIKIWNLLIIIKDNI